MLVLSDERAKSEAEENMPRKILKILISLLFLIVTAIAAVFAVKTFTHKSEPDSVSMKESNGIISSPNRPDATTRYGVVGVVKRLPKEQGIEALKSAADSQKQQETK